MKKLLLVLLLMFATVADAQVGPQMGQNAYGQPIVRITNTLPRPVSCFIRDQYNYYTFVVPPRSVSLWYPIYGPWQWSCS